MRLLHTITKTQTWGVSYIARPDGTIVVDMDDYHLRSALHLAAAPAQRAGAQWTRVANLVVEAALRPVELTDRGRLILCDRDTKARYTAVGQTIFKLITGMMDGAIPVQDGHAVTRWTWVCRTGSACLDLHAERASPQGAPVPRGVADLSDFVKTLGREG